MLYQHMLVMGVNAKDLIWQDDKHFSVWIIDAWTWTSSWELKEHNKRIVEIRGKNGSIYGKFQSIDTRKGILYFELFEPTIDIDLVPPEVPEEDQPILAADIPTP